MAYESFQDLINNLHSGVSDTAVKDTNIIEINEKRQFVLKDFDAVVAHEGDINSQIITFKLINSSDNHDLSACSSHMIKWKNLVSGIEGTSKLIKSDTITADGYFYVTWELPPEICTQAGSLEISIQIYDEDENSGLIVYSWNTDTYTGLSIGKSMNSVGIDFPAKDEILVINKETKQIVAPVGYNNVICNYGDKGAEIYFLVDRWLGKRNTIDVNDSNTKIAIYVVMNGYRGIDNSNRIEKQLYTEQIGEDENGLVLLTWKIPAGVTSGVGGANTLQIMLQFENDEQRWSTNIYSNLKVGESLFSMGEIPEGDLQLTEDLIEQIVQNYLDSGNFIEDYFNSANMIIDANIE